MTTPDASASGQKAALRAGIALAIFGLLAVLIFIFAPDALFEWAKAVHVIAVISWMAGMLYLPRLFVYHADAVPGSETSETFKIMERRLLRIIMNPAMIVAWVLGLWLAHMGGYLLQPWFIVKFLLVLVMSWAHGVLAKGVRLFAEDRNEKSARYWRVFNEVPTLAMIVIVIMVIVKPW